MKKTNRTDEELDKLCTELLSRQIRGRALELSIEDLKRLHSRLAEARNNHVPATCIINLGREAMVQFSDVSPQHFLIACNHQLSRDDFDFVTVSTWYGPEDSLQSFIPFLFGELKLNARCLVPLFLVSALLLMLAGSDDLYDLVSTLLIQATTVFLSIYLIFTVTQNQTLQTDRRLFQSGILQEYFADDRNITSLGVITIGLTFLNAMFIHASKNLTMQLVIYNATLGRSLWISLTTALAIILLFDTFLTVANYYLQRTKAVLERDMVASELHQDFLKYHPEDKEEGGQ